MRAYLVAGLAYGDEGKGATVDALVRYTGSDLVVRYNGGAQCAHNVTIDNGRHHTFSQFGSGSFVPGVRTFLSRYVLINPISMLMEARELNELGVDDLMSRTYVDWKTVIITPFQKSLNRLQEMARGSARHGSTGSGIGVTRYDHINHGDQVLLAGDLVNAKVTKEKLLFIRDLCNERVKDLVLPTSNAVNIELSKLREDSTIHWYVNAYQDWIYSGLSLVSGLHAIEYSKDIIFEGGQGVLLDEKYGFQPHTTWTDITYANATAILEDAGYKGDIRKIGVLRSYYTRHGDGPFQSEDSSMKSVIPSENHNTGEEYTGKFRIGSLDISLLLYSINVIGGVDHLAVNHMDVLYQAGKLPVRMFKGCTINVDANDFIPMLKELTRTLVSMQGYGTTYRHRIISEIL